MGTEQYTINVECTRFKYSVIFRHNNKQYEASTLEGCKEFTTLKLETIDRKNHKLILLDSSGFRYDVDYLTIEMVI